MILVTTGYFVANLRTFWRTFYRPEKCGDVPKLTDISTLRENSPGREMPPGRLVVRS